MDSESEGMNELALFAGAGGGILGGHLLGWRTVCAVEWEPYPASVLCARQNDGLLPPFPIWDDVQTFDGKPWQGIVDVVSGGFPCQDISAAGTGGGLLEAEVQCGNTWRELLAKYSPDTLSWKTAQCSLLEDLEQSLETWPRWGSMRNGECFRQPMLAQTISGKEFGLLQETWATPTTMDKLPPKSEMALLREATVARPNRSKPANLRDQVSNMKHWPTPLSSEHKANLTIRENHQNGLTAMVLKEQKNFPTPAARDYKGAVKTGKRVSASGKIQNYGEQLPNIVGGNLNPTWVEWLMGWPPGWTNLKPLEMDKSHFVQQQHGSS